MKFQNSIITTDRKSIKRVDIHSEFYTELFEKGGILAGGYARYITTDTDIDPHDVDIFCRKPENFEMLKKWLDSFCNEKANTEFAIMYEVREKYNYIQHVVQLIRPREEGNIKTYGSPVEIIYNFDFTINMVAIDAFGVYMADRFYMDMKKHRLIFNNIHCAVGILVRIRKYLKKGFSIPISEFAKIYTMWDSTDAETKKMILDAFLKESQDQEDEDRETITKRSAFKNFRRKDERIFKIFYID
jgi:hypothetical protein